MLQQVIIRLLCLASLLSAAPALHAGYPQNPLRADDALYVSQQGVYRFDAARAKPLWSSLVGVETHAPVIHGEQLLVGSTQGLYALDRASGRVNWRIEPARTIFTPAVRGQAFAGSLHGELYAIDPRDGRILWRRQFPGWIYSPALDPASGLLWSGGQMHEIYALALADGALRATLSTTQEAVFSPLDLGDGRAAFNLFDGGTLIVDMRARVPVGSLPGDAQPTGLDRRGDTLYRSQRDGSLSAFALADLSPRWRRRLVAQDLALHPSGPASLLASDLDQRLLLLDLASNGEACEARPRGRWSLPIQLQGREIAYFRKNLQPPELTLVLTLAKCNQ